MLEKRPNHIEEPTEELRVLKNFETESSQQESGETTMEAIPWIREQNHVTPHSQVPAIDNTIIHQEPLELVVSTLITSSRERVQEPKMTLLLSEADKAALETVYYPTLLYIIPEYQRVEDLKSQLDSLVTEREELLKQHEQLRPREATIVPSKTTAERLRVIQTREYEVEETMREMAEELLRRYGEEKEEDSQVDIRELFRFSKTVLLATAGEVMKRIDGIFVETLQRDNTYHESALQLEKLKKRWGIKEAVEEQTQEAVELDEKKGEAPTPEQMPKVTLEQLTAKVLGHDIRLELSHVPTTEIKTDDKVEPTTPDKKPVLTPATSEQEAKKSRGEVVFSIGETQFAGLGGRVLQALTDLKSSESQPVSLAKLAEKILGDNTPENRVKISNELSGMRKRLANNRVRAVHLRPDKNNPDRPVGFFLEFFELTDARGESLDSTTDFRTTKRTDTFSVGEVKFTGVRAALLNKLIELKSSPDNPITAEVLAREVYGETSQVALNRIFREVSNIRNGSRGLVEIGNTKYDVGAPDQPYGYYVKIHSPDAPVITLEKDRNEANQKRLSKRERQFLDILREHPEGLNAEQLRKLMGQNIKPAEMAYIIRKKDKIYSDLFAKGTGKQRVWILPESVMAEQKPIEPVATGVQEPVREIEIFESGENTSQSPKLKQFLANLRLLEAGSGVSRAILLSSLYPGIDDRVAVGRFEQLVSEARKRGNIVEKKGIRELAKYQLKEEASYSMEDQLVDLLRLNPNNAFSEQELLEMFYPVEMLYADETEIENAKKNLATLLANAGNKIKEVVGPHSTIEQIDIPVDEGQELAYYLDITEAPIGEIPQKAVLTPELLQNLLVASGNGHTGISRDKLLNTYFSDLSPEDANRALNEVMVWTQLEMGEAFRVVVKEVDEQNIISLELVESWEDTGTISFPITRGTEGQHFQHPYQRLSDEQALAVLTEISGSNQAGIEIIRNRLMNQYVIKTESEVNTIIAWIFLINADSDLAGDWMRHSSSGKQIVDNEIWGVFKRELNKMGIMSKKKAH